MGYEARCVARVCDADGAVREGEGAVLLETDELIVRGPARVRIPRASISEARAADGALVVTHAAGTVTLALGPDAEKWRARLAEPPKPLVDKLDVKPGARVWVSGVRDAEFLGALRERAPDARIGGAAPAECDVVFLAVERDADLTRVAKAARALAARGALWVVHPKGSGGVLDTAVFAAGQAAGLVATKVARFSPTHTAEKLVRPRGAGR